MASNQKNNETISNTICLPQYFTSQAGLKVKTFEPEWVIDDGGNNAKINISWLLNFEENLVFRDSLIDTLIHYVESKSALTVCTVTFAIRAAFPSDKIKVTEFTLNWHELADSTKKTLKGFISTAYKLNNMIFREFQEITKKFNFKSKFQGLDPTKGRLTDYEYDSMLQELRVKCNAIPKTPPKDFSFYSSNSGNKLKFESYKSIICYRTMVQLARRPKQISFLRWSDVLPVFISFQDKHIEIEPLHTGLKELHVRCYKIKQGDTASFRNIPEMFTIKLTESFSQLLLKYCDIYRTGFKLALERSGNYISENEITTLMANLPLFPSQDLFITNFDKKILNTLRKGNSKLFHLSEGSITAYAKTHGKCLSDRKADVIATNNRLRHTWLCNAAIRGESIEDISKITNVTLPAARHYLQLGLEERQYIDNNYNANELLRNAFKPQSLIFDSDEVIENEIAEIVGVEKEKPTCTSCDHKIRMVRPIPCYGCSNFIPILEADHNSILEQAIAKRKYISQFGSSNTTVGSTERLDKAIKYIRITIAVCNEEMANLLKIEKGKRT
ncbi:hypothetical protein [Pseudoalteromonas rhizosphaerae]|uniref:hypothetical protein n=1 Tax=Pseudoalteromonas rhizosphaerae TaxID=2518973 RepID=UPI0012306ED3|nr:hypothetical protein [Pseudoalteromonas rhizosphaerae]